LSQANVEVKEFVEEVDDVPGGASRDASRHDVRDPG
jgi:hypothetical protein